MSIDKYFASRFHLVADVMSYDETEGNPEVLRPVLEFNDGGEDWQVPTSVEVREDTARGPHGPVPLRIYAPRETSRRRHGLLWMRGGLGLVGLWIGLKAMRC